MKLKRKLPADRSYEQLLNHYQVERVLASKLKSARRQDRPEIYKHMYDELFSKVPDHPRLTRRRDATLSVLAIKEKRQLVNKYIDKSKIFVEWGPGDCKFAIDLCKDVNFVFGIDVADQIAKDEKIPDNFKLIVFDGYHLDIENNFADVVFSDQLIEHIPPDDAPLHFNAVKSILKPGGVYICRCPHRYAGPSDISKYFSDVAEGFHLKEYTYTELRDIVLGVCGFRKCFALYKRLGVVIRMPYSFFTATEYVFKFFPVRARGIILRRIFRGVIIVAVK